MPYAKLFIFGWESHPNSAQDIHLDLCSEIMYDELE